MMTEERFRRACRAPIYARVEEEGGIAKVNLWNSNSRKPKCRGTRKPNPDCPGNQAWRLARTRPRAIKVVR